MNDSYLHQHIDKQTRKRGNDDPSLLHIILTDEFLQISDIDHLSPLGKRYYSVITCDFNFYLDYAEPKEKYCYDKFNSDMMRDDFVNSKWIHEFEKAKAKTSVEEKWKSLSTMMKKVRDDHVPELRISGKPKWNHKGSFPLNEKTREVIKEKMQLSTLG